MCVLCCSGETLLSPLVMCSPHGLKFQKPVELRLPHCASMTPDGWSFALKSSDSSSGTLSLSLAFYGVQRGNRGGHWGGHWGVGGDFNLLGQFHSWVFTVSLALLGVGGVCWGGVTVCWGGVCVGWGYAPELLQSVSLKKYCG